MKIIFCWVVCFLLFIAVDVSDQRRIIWDEAVTTSNDSLSSGWVTVTGANIALNYTTDDTSWVWGKVSYRYRQFDSITLAVGDTLSLDTRGSTARGLSKGKILRGFGTTTDLIPGATDIQVVLFKLGGEATTTVGCGLIDIP